MKRLKPTENLIWVMSNHIDEVCVETKFGKYRCVKVYPELFFVYLDKLIITVLAESTFKEAMKFAEEDFNQKLDN